MTATEPPAPRFEVLRPLGKGATARVDLVRLLEPLADLPRGAELACKTLETAAEHRAAARAAFRAEAETAAAVRDPSLVRVLHHGERDGAPYLLMQYVPGRTLREVLQADGPLPEPRLRPIGAELARALAALHAHGYVHGDVKPENVRLDEEGRAVLLDLGFARRVREHDGHAVGGDAGSLAYLAPERVRGEPAGPAADVFALGIVLYELATGLHPFGESRAMARLLGRVSSAAAIARRSIELPGADELLAALDAARYVPPSRFAPALSPFLDRLLAEALDRTSAERPSAADLEQRLAEGELGAWWRERLDPSAEDEHEPGGWPLVGRDAELDALAAIHAEVVAASPPRASIVWLSGPEGSGKWRLLSAFAGRVRAGEHPPLVLDARWSEADEARPGGLCLMLLNRWLALPAGSPPSQHGPDGGREAARLGEVVGAASARALIAALDPRARDSVDRSVPAELARWIAALAAARPVLVHLDDLHRAGAVTLGALSEVLELLRDARVTFVLALREDCIATEPDQLARLLERLERGAASGGPALHRITLPALPLEAVAELVERLFHEDAPRTRLAELLWRKSRGNPGFLTEILRELEATGRVVPASAVDPRWTLVGPPEKLPTPRSLDRLVKERVRALEPGERVWLERLCVVGGRLTPEFLMAAFPPSKRGEIDELLARLARKGWLVPAADRYRFERPALREALYRALPAGRRRRLHAAAARGLAGDERDLEQAYQRAYHLHAAGEHAELLDSVRRILPALRRRASALRLSTLARWGLEALEALPALPDREERRLELLEDAADAADRLGRREDQRLLLDLLASSELDPERYPHEAARLYLLHARYAAGTGQFGLARGWLKTATTLAERSGDRWLSSQALRRLAQVQAQIGEFGNARELAGAALAEAQGENQEALAHLALAHVDVLEDDLDRALAEIDAAFRALKRTQEPRAGVLAYAELLRARVWRSAGGPRRGLAAVQRAVVLARRAGERRLEAEALARRGTLLLDLDRPGLARAELTSALLLADEIQDRRGQVLSNLMLAWLDAEEGAPRAGVELERALELAREIGFYRAEALALALSARLRHGRGEHESAEVDSARALELLERHGAELSDRIVIAGTRVLVLRSAGRAAEADGLAAELARRTRASQRRIRDRALRAAQRDYAERLLASALSDRGPVFPRGR